MGRNSCSLQTELMDRRAATWMCSRLKWSMPREMYSLALSPRWELEKAVRTLGPALEGLHTSFDPDATGGAHLLGTRGVVVIAHGSASRTAIANAIDLTAEGVEDELVAKVEAGVAGVAPVPG